MTLDIIDTRQLDAGPDGWRDTFTTFPRTLEDAEKAFQDRIDDLVSYSPDRFASDDRGSAIIDATRPT